MGPVASGSETCSWVPSPAQQAVCSGPLRSQPLWSRAGRRPAPCLAQRLGQTGDVLPCAVRRLLPRARLTTAESRSPAAGQDDLALPDRMAFRFRRRPPIPALRDETRAFRHLKDY
ncbi:hypothetical protein H920_06929 [Fukomys damarensis]|uniref:Uncharacterized protein n=1 Tax=Fukomys damarensis TaxID=885580 RepID=A0A091DNB0_FUKDA|nr:hypothetical protein H920_06929 [Fukomys damarensis]